MIVLSIFIPEEVYATLSVLKLSASWRSHAGSLFTNEDEQEELARDVLDTFAVIHAGLVCQ